VLCEEIGIGVAVGAVAMVMVAVAADAVAVAVAVVVVVASGVCCLRWRSLLGGYCWSTRCQTEDGGKSSKLLKQRWMQL